MTREMIAEVAGDCSVFVPKEGEKVRSPGMKYKHYSPNCRTMLFDHDRIDEAVPDYEKQRAEGLHAYIMCDGQSARCVAADVPAEHILLLGEDGEEIAANLYYRLREGEKKADIIIAVAPEDKSGVMVGVMNRLTKACGG